MELRTLLRLQREITMATQVFPAYRIFTDATADLNTALQSGLPPIEVIPMEVQVGEAAYTYGPQGNLMPDAFYQMLREGQFASTSQINPQTYRKAFEKAMKADGPYLIDVPIDMDEFVLPMLPPGGSIEDIITTKKREGM